MTLPPRARGRRRQFANQDTADRVDVRAPPKEELSAEAKARQLCADWKLQIELAEQRNEKWETRCKRILKRYREERPDGDTGTPRRMNVLWSNIQTLQPCVYGRQPVPIAERRFLDQDDTGRVGSQILERALRYEMNFCGFHDSVEQAVFDYLAVGRGVAWLRYKPIVGPATSLTDRGSDQITDRFGEPLDGDGAAPDFERDDHNESDAQTNETPDEKLLSASLEVDYVHWSDFFHSKARFWKENMWVARRLYPSRQDLIDDFGEEIGRDVPLEMTPELSREDQGTQRSEVSPDSMKKAVIYEIWDKPTRTVYTIAKGFDRFLEEPREDPLNLEQFWPCPKPLFATMTNDTLEPVPDYIEYQDQALEIDDLTNRINQLIKALKVAGVYDSSQKQLARLLDEGHENKLIGVPSWAAFAEKGGLKSAVDFLPIDQIAKVLEGLFEARDKIKQDLFEITGLSDIIRGQADPRETAEAVSTKGRWGSLRLQARQANVARFCRDIICLMGEVISEHFPEETLINVSGVMYDDGIGGTKPTAPSPSPSPLIGHNGGPPMGAAIAPGGPGNIGRPIGPSTAVPPIFGQPPAGQPLQPHPGLVPPGLGQPPGLTMPPLRPSPQLAGPPAFPGPLPGAPGAALPPPDPMMQYRMAMMNYEAQKMGLVQKAIGLLRQDKLRGFRIDIETDSTIASEANEDKRSRIEFITATTEFIEKGFQVGSQVPEAVPMLGKMMLFGVRGFRAGRDLESTIEEFVDKMEKAAAQKADAPPAPNPELQKQQLQLQAVQEKSQAEVKKAQLDSQASADDNRREMAAKQMDASLAAEQVRADMAKMQQEGELRRAEFEQRMQEMHLKMQMMLADHAQDQERSRTEHRMQMERLTATKEKAA